MVLRDVAGLRKIGNYPTPAVSYIDIRLASCRKNSTQKNQDLYCLLNLLGDAFEEMRSEYGTGAIEDRFVEAAVNGMLAIFDSSSDGQRAKIANELRRVNGLQLLRTGSALRVAVRL